MIRRCFMVVDMKERESLHLTRQSALDYAARPTIQGRIVNMFGKDGGDDDEEDNVIDVTLSIPGQNDDRPVTPLIPLSAANWPWPADGEGYSG